MARIVRKTHPTSQTAIDEQFWPVMLALFILAGFVMGTIAAYLEFGARRWWQDARTWLLVIPAVTCLIIWLLRFVPSRLVKRALQISIVLCALFHVIMLVVSIEARIFSRPDEQAQIRRRRQPPERRVMPTYQAYQHDPEQRRQQDFTKPVETKTPDPVPDRIERKEPPREEPPTEPPPMPAPQTTREVQRQTLERREMAETTPRQSEQVSKMSKQTAMAKPQPSEPVATPQTAAPTAQASAFEARSERLRKREAELAAPAQQTPDPATVAPSDSPTIARRAMERAPASETKSSPTLTRQLAQPQAIPRVDARTGDAPSVAKQTTAQEIEPARTTARQQLTTSPTAQPVAAPSTTTAVAVTTPNPRREQPSPSQPQLAQTPIPVPNLQSRTTPRAEPARTAPRIATTSATNSNTPPTLESTSTNVRQNRATSQAVAEAVAASVTAKAESAASTTNVARRQSTSNAPSANTLATASTPRTVAAARNLAPTTMAEAPTASANRSGAEGALASRNAALQPAASQGAVATARQSTSAPASTTTAMSSAATRTETANSSAAPATGNAASQLARSTRPTERATSTNVADQPRQVAADAGVGDPQARPSKLAMSQSLSGIAGVGQTANLDRAPATPGSPSLLASGSARRAEATQNQPTGPALAPSDAALVRHSLAGRERPAASLQATTTGIAAATGSVQPMELSQTASGSLVQQNSNAAHSDVTAAKGTVDVDLGPTRVADASGFERAAGGGQPELNFATDAKSVARATSSGNATRPTATNLVDVVTSSPGSESSPGSAELAAGGANVKQAADIAMTGGATQTVAEPKPGDGGGVDSLPASTLARTNNAADAPALGDAGDGLSDEDDEEKRRRLARRSRGATGPAGSLAGPATTDAATQLADSSGPTTSASEIGDSVATGMTRSDAASAAGTMAGVPIATNVGSGGGEVLGEASLQRAEAVDAIAGPAVQGGGTAATERTAASRAFSASVTADTTRLAGAPMSGGAPMGAEAATQGYEPSATTAGVIGRAAVGDVGALTGDLLRDAAVQQGFDAVAGNASRSPTAGDSPAIGVAADSAAPLARSTRTQFNAGTQIAVSETPEAPSSLSRTAGLNEPALGASTGPTTRQTTGAVPIEVAALDGPGGLGTQPALDVGVSSRLATDESVTVQSTPARFQRQFVGGTPQLNTAAVFSSEAFRPRAMTRPGDPGATTGAVGPQTEVAIELGLEFLAKRQLPDGSWTLGSPGEPVQLASDTAATGLAMLAFQGAGYNHREFKYAARVRGGVEFLLKHQKPDGDLYISMDSVSNRSVALYSHGIAAIALCEAYGMTQDPRLRQPAQKALDFIVATQDPKGGGWRYQPGVESDTSVSGWMMMALKSGELAGLNVKQPTYDHIRRWLDTAQGAGGERHLFRYNPFAPDTESQRHGRAVSPTMTAVGLLMRLYGGWKRDHEAMVAGAEYLQANGPTFGTARESKHDTYYWYYGTQVMFHMGGKYWEDWNGRLHPMLIGSQLKRGDDAGSWSPRSPTLERWAPQAGRLYVTTMNLLSLEVTYRHLPLYVDTAR